MNYVKKQSAIAALYKYKNDLLMREVSDSVLTIVMGCIEQITALPDEDVEPVINAEWDCDAMCTNCGEQADYDYSISEWMTYDRCPHCGAHMTYEEGAWDFPEEADVYE